MKIDVSCGGLPPAAPLCALPDLAAPYMLVRQHKKRPDYVTHGLDGS
jgi:hypothetical protein